MSKIGKTTDQIWERRDELSLAIEPRMEFTMSKKINIKDEGEDDGIEIHGVKFKKGMKFELKHELKLKKEQFGEETGIEIEGKKKFTFQKDDTIIVDRIDIKEGIIFFHIERKKKKVKNDKDENIEFKVDGDKFTDIFEEYADIEVNNMFHFRFKKGDIIVVEERHQEPFPKINPEDEEKIRTQITFHVNRKGKIMKDLQGNNITFTFNAGIFLQNFESISNVETVIAQAIDEGKKKVEETL